MANETEDRVVEITQDELIAKGIDVDEIGETLLDLISDKTGFCVRSFGWSIKVDAQLDVSE